MNGYRDVRSADSTANDARPMNSGWAERTAFINDHDRTPVQRDCIDIKRLVMTSCGILVVITIIMLCIDSASGGDGHNSSNITNYTDKLLSA